MDLGSIYRKAYELTKKHKSLWVLGMAVAAFSGGSSINFSRSFSFDSKDSESLKKLLENGGEGVVKGAQSVRDAESFKDFFIELLKSVPNSTWTFLALCLLAALTTATIVGIIIRNWSRGALIGGVKEATGKDTVSLYQASTYGKKSIKQLFLANLITSAIMLLPLVVGALSYSTLALIKGNFNIFEQANSSIPTAIIVAFGIIFFLTTLISTITFLALSISLIWAHRLIVIENMQALSALKLGTKLAKENLGNMLQLGLANCFVQSGLGCMAFIVVLALGAGTAGILSLNQTAGIVAGIIMGIIILPLILSSILIMGIITVFKYTTWNLLFEEIRKNAKQQ